MAGWNPAEILQEPNLRLTEAEVTDIRRRLPPPQDGQLYIDGVFEGGGVRGIAFLGALRCFADVGVRWRKVAGTSAGAITAALVAADFPIEELEQIIGNLNYVDFLTQKTSRLIWNGDPANDLGQPIRMILLLLLSRQLGQYSSAPFRNWIAQTLARRNLKTFADVKADSERDLKVVASDISRGEMLVLPDDLDRADVADPQYRALKQLLATPLSDCNQFEVAEAVRLSMSIPFFFEPGILGSPKDPNARRIVDGGILSNFPLWIYDFKPNPTEPTKRCPRWPTFGLRLVEQDNRSEKPITGPFDMLGAMFRTMMVARDQYHLNQASRDRVIEIDVTEANVTATEFNLTDEKKRILYRLGYLHAKNFLLYAWDWEKHLRRRGFEPQDCD
ncbi:patatin-like phospholipase family protein [Leptolyngbya sp. NK1-12]|uniref:Patatin-like phospholipase family protein n=1 Tax=Leptolyngbya sp. NK1-12 TaxID=2547451 RepID=A0AA97AH69_9CYAN|nr:patatin-like phospholipase family protein [Leptolyngbya sp. NK1-12]WNZ24239.1 patatin-like phospholipase family protein [Leptolyngbya sp. NK1-12]